MGTTRRVAGVALALGVSMVLGTFVSSHSWGGATGPVAAAGTATPEFGVAGTSVLRANETPDSRDESLRAVRVLRAKWLRMDVQWDAIERSRGRYTWVILDRFVAEAAASRLKVLAVLQRTPPWARPAKTWATHPPVTVAQFDAYARFVRAFAERYTRASARRIHAVEVWNEPNAPASWSGPMLPSRYVELLRRTHTAVKAVNRSTTVVTGGLAPAHDTATSRNPRTFLRSIYGAGGKRYFDAVGMHPYTFPALPSANEIWGWGNMTRPSGSRPSLRATMEANGDGGKRIWATEYGSPVDVVGEARQAELAVDAVRVWSSYPWAGPMFYFSLHDVPRVAWDRSMGLLRDDGSRRPVFEALRSAIWLAQHPDATTTTASTTTTEPTTTTEQTTTTSEPETTTTSEPETTTTTEPETTTTSEPETTTTTEPESTTTIAGG